MPLTGKNAVDDLTPKIERARESIAALYTNGEATTETGSSPDGRFRRNSDAVAVSRALLEVFEDVEPFVYEASQTGEHHLLTHWGIDPGPLFTLNSPQLVARGVRKLFGVDVAGLRVDFEQVRAHLVKINAQRILGKSTAAKMAYLKPITGRAFRHLTAVDLQDNFPEVIGATIELLKRQAKRLQRQAAACTQIDRQILLLSELHVRYRLNKRFTSHPLFAANPDHFYNVYADEAAQLVAAHADNPCFGQPVGLNAFRYLRNTGIEVAYTPRNGAFLHSGDYYGDCTASEVRSQVDPDIANIHWTVYAWLLDPHYRVLDVFFHGRRVLKGHILPLIIQGRRVLMLDAIETIPSIRDFLRGKKNRNISRSIYARRIDILQALFAVVKDLAGQMGVQAVYVDKYSNTKWVREEVGKLPSDSYHINDVIKPFKNDLIEAVIRKILKTSSTDVAEEIQARNISLMDQQLRPNYKEVGVLMGRRKDYFIAVRGI
ncbi:MAG: hypothetical protein GY697_20370 [Desulfobacterales bacterium]|nr:hypothetical protein [Desulfobacterales bacterium]